KEQCLNKEKALKSVKNSLQALRCALYDNPIYFSVFLKLYKISNHSEWVSTIHAKTKASLERSSNIRDQYVTRATRSKNDASRSDRHPIPHHRSCFDLAFSDEYRKTRL